MNVPDLSRPLIGLVQLQKDSLRRDREEINHRYNSVMVLGCSSYTLRIYD